MDAVRGLAVLGILIMNILGMGMPAYAHDDPTYYGGSHGADLATWAISTVLVEGKMRALFAMLFGASSLLIAERTTGKPGPMAIHYRRMAWLFLFGLAHAYLLWWGDILTTYAIAGLFLFPVRKAPARALLGVGGAMLAGFLMVHVWGLTELSFLARAAAAPGADPEFVDYVQARIGNLGAPPAMAAAEVQSYGGGFSDALAARARMATWLLISPSSMTYIVEALGLMLIGMGLYRTGFFTLGWRTAGYLKMMAAGYLVCLPVAAVLAFEAWKSGFEPLTLYLTSAWQAPTWALMGLAHASAFLLVIRFGLARGLVRLLAAAGRMALSNYLMSSLITMIVFSGFGFGLYGKLSRAELMVVVAGVWAFILAWSAPWLARFHYGPFEWVWRSLTRARAQPLVRRRPAT
jgi:uncharacterized protein